MLTMRYSLIVLVVSLVFVVPASSQESSDHKAITQKDQKAEQKKSPPENKYAPIEERKSEPIQNASEQPKAHTDEKLEIDRKIAEYTGQLSVYTKDLSVYTQSLSQFTLMLVIATAVVGAIGIWQGIQLRSSVNLARDEFRTTHRPRLIVRRISPVEENKTAIGMQYTVHNIGDTEGTIIAVSEQVWMPGNMDTVPIPAYTGHIAKAITLKCGDWITIIHSPPRDVLMDVCFRTGFGEESVKLSITSPPPDIIFMGYIDYIDGMCQKRQTAFLRKLDFNTKRFNPIPHPEYEYQD